MKKFIKGRWFPLLVEIIVFWVVAFVMAKFGWRITYAPDLENSWDAVSGVASWVGVIIALAGVVASFLAVWAAIRIPKEIAREQNNITQIEHRQEIKETIHELSGMIQSMELDNLCRANISNDRDQRKGYMYLFMSYLENYTNNQKIIKKYNSYFGEYQETVKDFFARYKAICYYIMCLMWIDDKADVIRELQYAIEETNEFIKSDKFSGLCTYMEQTLNVNK